MAEPRLTLGNITIPAGLNIHCDPTKWSPKLLCRQHAPPEWSFMGTVEYVAVMTVVHWHASEGTTKSNMTVSIAGHNCSISDTARPTNRAPQTNSSLFQMRTGCDWPLRTPCVRSFYLRAATKIVRFCFCLFEAEGHLRAHVRTLLCTSVARSRLNGSHAFCTFSNSVHGEHYHCHTFSDHTDLAVSLASRSLLLVWLMVDACIASA